MNTENKELRPETIKWLESMDPMDDYGFWLRCPMNWLPESLKDEQDRLQWNVDKYEAFIKNGSNFPREVNERLMRNYTRLAFLKSGLRGIE